MSELRLKTALAEVAALRELVKYQWAEIAVLQERGDMEEGEQIAKLETAVARREEAWLEASERARELADFTTELQDELTACRERVAELEKAQRMNYPALRDVLAERVRQDAAWGEQNHDTVVWLGILLEGAGELAQAALHALFDGPASENVRAEAVRVAAVALAIVECLDRNEGPSDG